LRLIKHKITTYFNKKQRVSGHYKYTIVSAVYHVEKYLDEYFDSLVTQTLKFNEHIHLIMVDDGSNDNSAQIIKRWQKKFPDNITYIKKENGGQASARNLGMHHVKTEWVTFIDPDDFVKYNYFETVDTFLQKKKTFDFAMIACNLLFYYEKDCSIKDTHPLKYKFKKKESIFPVNDLKQHIQLPTHSVFFHTKELKKTGLQFSEKVKPTFEDAHFLNRFLLQTSLFEKESFVGFIKDAKYYYRKRSDDSSTLDGAWGKEERYNDQLRYGYLSLLKNAYSLLGFVPIYVQRTVLYDVIWYFKRLIDHDERINFLNADQIKIFQNLLEEIFTYIDANTIDTFNLAGCTHFHKVGLIKRYKDTEIEKIIYIENYDTIKDEITLRYFCTNNCNESFMLNDKKTVPNNIKIKDHYFLNDLFIYEKIICLPLEKNSLTLKVRINNVSSKISLGDIFYKNSIHIIDIENFFNNIPQTYHTIESISSTSTSIKIEAVVNCVKFDNIDYFWSSVFGVLPHKVIHRYNDLVRYQIELYNDKKKVKNDIELFYAFNKNGKKDRVWKPGHYLTKENLPNGYYFTNRYLNLSYRKGQPDRYTFFTPALRDINYTESLMKIEGYLFLPLEKEYDLNQFKIKLSKFRDESITMQFPLEFISPERIKIFNHFSSQNFYIFNQLKVFLFKIEIPLISISDYVGIFNIGVEYNDRTRLIQNYHTALSKQEHTTTYSLDNDHLTLFNFYYDDMSSVWRFEIYHMSQNEFLQLKKLTLAKTRDKKIWIIGEYSISARDNGMHFYHYMLHEHPEIDVYYIIEKDSKDLPYLKQEKVLYYGSYKHFEIASKAKVLVFSHMERYLIPKINDITEYKENNDAYLKVFLQHGVIATTASIDFLHKKLRAYNIFNVSSEFEKKVVKEYLGYSDQEIVINGLPRWDKLYSDKMHTKTILIIPTWRNDLEKVTDEVFQQSEYFKFWNTLLSDHTFISYIEENDIKVDFFIHIILS
ncbi:MAG: glycosyltransferase, partial [Bacteroidales bacterium]|nr:glycosyltransferase [Bacteroidales bacterium]